MATLDAERTRAANLDIQILAPDSDSEGSLSALRAERTLVQERLDSYRYPVLTLPNEIVSEIFVHFLPVYPKCPPLNGLHSPNNLTQICGKWRDIALTTPELWRAMKLSITRARNIPFDRQVHELDMWLSRSSFCPFSIEVHLPFNRSEGFVFSAARAARWEHLKAFNVIPPSSITQVPMPLLRHLDIGFYSQERRDSFVFGQAPLLRSVALNNTAARMLILPWAQLTSLTFKRVFPHGCVSVLQKTPNLVHCKLLLYDDRSNTSPLPDVTLLRLESLTLVRDSRSPNTQTKYWETFVIPALSKLHIEETILENPIDTIVSFMVKSGCRLREMHISGERHIRTDTYSQAFPSVKLSFDEEYPGETGDLADLTESESNSL